MDEVQPTYPQPEPPYAEVVRERNSAPIFLWIGLGVLGFIFLIGFALIVPLLLAAREAARRAQCQNNMKQIGLSFQNMDSCKKRFPPACRVTTGSDRGETSFTDPGCGWSWAVYILPFMEGKSLYDALDLRNETPFTGYGTPGASSYMALAVPVRQYACPSFSGSRFVDPDTKAECINNYKVSGATHAASLARATMIDPKPEPGYPAIHPDGACYPGSRHGSDGFSKDGTAHTILVVETTEPYFARWTVGQEAVLVGLPDAVKFTAASRRGPFYAAPVGYSQGRFWDRSTIPPENDLTYLDWDYDTSPYDDQGVLSAPGGLVAEIPPAIPKSLRNPPKSVTFGPSSHHARVTNHGLADGSVLSISDDIDAAAYMFLITRNGGDPKPLRDPDVHRHLGMNPRPK